MPLGPPRRRRLHFRPSPFPGGPIKLLSAHPPTRAAALVEGAAFVLLASVGIVLVKLSLAYAGPLTLAALRFFLAFVLLLPLLLRERFDFKGVSRARWGQLLLLGVLAYTLGNAVGFVGLAHLPASTAAFVTSFSPVLTLVAGALWLKERPNRLQLLGVGVLLGGMAMFFHQGVRPGQWEGFLYLTLSMVSLMLFWLLSRKLARDNAVRTLPLTALPLGLGGGLLLAVAPALEGVVVPPPPFWGLLAVLVVFCTALSFTLYNHALQTLTAFEMNVLISTVPLVTALLATVALGEALGPVQLAGMGVAAAGVVLVQLKRTRPAAARL